MRWSRAPRCTARRDLTSRLPPVQLFSPQKHSRPPTLLSRAYRSATMPRITAKRCRSSSPSPASSATPISSSASKKQLLYASALNSGTPFPHWPHPTPLEAQAVVSLLSSVHGLPQRPKVLVDREDAPAGCGQVPSVLDALVRTILSQNTTSRNSTAAKEAMDRVYGRANYRAVLEGGEAKLEETIRCGGLAKNKSKAIVGILKRLDGRNAERGGKVGEGELSLDWLHELVSCIFSSTATKPYNTNSCACAITE